MKIKMVIINLELSKRAKRIAAAVLVPALVLAGGAIAYANVPKTWVAGDTLKAADLNGNFTALDLRLAALEQGAAITDAPCPAGYKQDTAAPAIVLCKGADEVVKVGAGATAFWIDRYEASVWSGPLGTGTQFGATANDYPGTFPANGQVTHASDALYAASVEGVQPSEYATWFQRSLACVASGKRLPSNAEWQLAATGTNDPGASDGANGACLTQASNKRATGAIGADTACASLWGAEDMIGNVWELTSDWSVAPGGGLYSSPWPASYNGDGTNNVASSARRDLATPGYVQGLPAVVGRGGSYVEGLRSGVFMLDVNTGPTWAGGGFRCVVPR